MIISISDSDKANSGAMGVGTNAKGVLALRDIVSSETPQKAVRKRCSRSLTVGLLAPKRSGAHAAQMLMRKDLLWPRRCARTGSRRR